jgi:hypothetical protein
MYVMGRTGGEQALCSWDFFTKHTASCWSITTLLIKDMLQVLEQARDEFKQTCFP